MTPANARRAATCVAVLAIMAAAAVLAVVVPAWYRFHPHMPWQDTLPLLRGLRPLLEEGPNAERLWQLLQPHYTAHRVLIPRLLLLADTIAFGGRSHLLYFSGLLGAALVAWCFLRLAHRQLRSGSAFAVAGALVVIYLFSPAHLWNYLNPINSSWPLSIGLALLALYLLLSNDSPSVWRVLTALFAALSAAFTNFAGVLVWLLIPLALIGRRHRFAPWSVLLSTGVVAMYLHGIHTDAEIASSMAAKDPANAQLQSYAEMAQRLQADNGPLDVMANSVRTLSWPLNETHRPLATALALASFALLAFAWLWSARRWWRSDLPARGWMEFSLLGATFCLGVAVSTHMGRVLPYPQVEHAASAARYQSYVVVYWLCISGLVMAWLSQREGRSHIAATTTVLSLAMVLVLLPPPGYQDLELRSAEYAAMLYTVGESDALRPVTTPSGLSFTPDYVLAFDRFFAARGIVWHGPAPLAPSAAGLPGCNGFGLSVGPGHAPAAPMHAPRVETPIRALSASIENWRAILTREILLFDDDGRLVARMYPHHGNDFPTWPGLGGATSGWLGAVPALAPIASVAVTIAMPGASLACRLRQ